MYNYTKSYILLNTECLVILFSVIITHMRNVIISPGEHYHILNRGNNKQPIFLDKRDKARFLFLLLYFQSDVKMWNIGYYVNHFTKHSVFSISRKQMEEVEANRYVELINFAFMPNHFHLTAHELKENGISRYMQRTLNGYTKYFNAKYKKSGHLFQGPYKAIHIQDNDQLLYLSAYIHNNPKELTQYQQRTSDYPWSSYQDYIKENRWGSLLQCDIIREQFTNGMEYKNFVETSGAKEIKKYLDDKHLLYK